MDTPICPVCGCSLVRLGISRESAFSCQYKQKTYWFCCAGCLQIFNSNPEKYLAEFANWVVCPVCLSEKPSNLTVSYQFNDETLNFCRCPFCLEVFDNSPDYFVQRLSWNTNYSGLIGDKKGCCAKH